MCPTNSLTSICQVDPTYLGINGSRLHLKDACREAIRRAAALYQISPTTLDTNPGAAFNLLAPAVNLDLDMYPPQFKLRQKFLDAARFTLRHVANRPVSMNAQDNTPKQQQQQQNVPRLLSPPHTPTTAAAAAQPDWYRNLQAALLACNMKGSGSPVGIGVPISSPSRSPSSFPSPSISASTSASTSMPISTPTLQGTKVSSSFSSPTMSRSTSSSTFTCTSGPSRNPWRAVTTPAVPIPGHGNGNGNGNEHERAGAPISPSSVSEVFGSSRVTMPNPNPNNNSNMNMNPNGGDGHEELGGPSAVVATVPVPAGSTLELLSHRLHVLPEQGHEHGHGQTPPGHMHVRIIKLEARMASALQMLRCAMEEIVEVDKGLMELHAEW